jgi:AcrR family transcriptional regulator
MCTGVQSCTRVQRVRIPECGPREARKERTRGALVAAAIAIVQRDGAEALTAARIADEAEVSRRTFFNYFPKVEDALTAGLSDLVAAGIDAFLARPHDEPLRDSVRAVLDDLFDADTFAQTRALELAGLESPATRRLLLEYNDLQADALEDALRRRLGDDADPVYVAALSGATHAALFRVSRVSMALDADLDDATASERHHERIRRALDLLFAGFPDTTTSPAGGAHPTPEV